MKIFNDKAAALLYEKVKSLDSQPHDSWRCIYVNLSDKRERYSHSLRKNFVVRAITQLLADMDGYIYLCDDGDIFIMFQGPAKPVISLLATHFDGLTPEAMGKQPEDNIFTIFDLSMYWKLFYKLCQAKFRMSHADGAGLPFWYNRNEIRYAEALQ